MCHVITVNRSLPSVPLRVQMLRRRLVFHQNGAFKSLNCPSHQQNPQSFVGLRRSDALRATTASARTIRLPTSDRSLQRDPAIFSCIPAAASLASVSMRDPTAPLRLRLAIAVAYAALWSLPGTSVALQAEPPLALESRADFAAVGDLNSDGLDDLLLITSENGGGEIVALLNDAGSATHLRVAQQIPLIDSPGRPALGDMNGDGRLDAVVPIAEGDGLFVFTGLGDGTFFEGPLFFYAGLDTSVAVIADFDNANGLDIAIGDRRTGDVLVLLNDGNSLPCLQIALRAHVGSRVEEMAVSDFNRDGRLDVATLSRAPLTTPENADSLRRGRVAVLLAQPPIRGLPVFAVANSFDADDSPSDLQVADVNGDGASDLLYLNQPEGVEQTSLRMLLNGGDGTVFAPTSQLIACPFYSRAYSCPARALTAGDLDDDGYVDFAFAMSDPRGLPTQRPAADVVSIARGRADGSSQLASIAAIPLHPVLLRIGDFSGYGRPGVAAITTDTPAATILIQYDPAGEVVGTLCGSGGECASNRCINGVCCATPCTTGERCDVPGREGFCAPPATIEKCANDDECEGADTPFCLDDYCCDACPDGHCDVFGFEGICLLPFADGEPCGSDRACASGHCRGGVCCSSGCAPWASCAADSGFCEGLLFTGQECNDDRECASRICDRFDGVCCSEVCDGYQTCAAPGSVGVCTTLFPPPNRDPRCPALITCSGDCDNDRAVALSELITGAQISLSLRSISDCPAANADTDDNVDIHELILAVRAALFGC